MSLKQATVRGVELIDVVIRHHGLVSEPMGSTAPQKPVFSLRTPDHRALCRLVDGPMSIRFQVRGELMIYDGSAVRARLMLLRDTLTVVKDRTELDPFDDAMYNAISYMLELSETHSISVESLLKTVKKMERKSR